LIYRFESYVLDRDGRELRRGPELLAVEPQVFDLLLLLIGNRERVVSKDEILTSVWGGRIVSESTLASRINAARRVIGDSGDEQRWIRTIIGKGLRFVGPVREDETANAVVGPTDADEQKPSIAVLPFINLTGDVEQDYFVDGVVEEITTALSRIRWLFVIARNSSFTYKGKVVDLKQVGRELGVRYILEGSVRKSVNRVRISSKLIDTTTGAHFWAERFDGKHGDIFKLRDQVASNVAGAIEPKLRQSEIERATRKPTNHLDAYDLYLRAVAQYHRWSPESLRDAARLLAEALAIDPSYAPAAALLAICRSFQKANGWDILSNQEMVDLTALAKQAVDNGKDDPDVLSIAGCAISYFTGDHASGLRLIERALVLNTNSALAWEACGYVLTFACHPDPAIDCFKRAMRLSPLDPLHYQFKAGLAFAHMVAGRYLEAMEWVDRTMQEQSRHTVMVRVKAALCGHLGRTEEGREWVKRTMELYPGVTIGHLERYLNPHLAPTPVQLEGLRKVGFPET
jgi:TolB-like protein